MKTPGIYLLIFIVVAGLIGTTACNHAGPTPTPTATPIPPTSTPGLLDLVKSYEEAFNRHDVDAVMALLSDNVTMNLADFPDQAGSKQQAHDLIEFWFGNNVEFHYSDCKTTGSIVGCVAVASLDCSKAAGMSGINFSIASFTINSGKIDQIFLQMKPDDETTYNTFLTNMEQWANKVHPDEMLKIIPSSDTLVFNSENGTIYSGLCKEYAAINH